MLYLFDVFIILTTFFALSVIINRNPIYSVFSLILVFVNTAILLLMLEVEFLALLLIIIYVGAVAILFLFVIMLLNLREFNKIKLNKFNFIFVLLVSINALIMFAYVFNKQFIEYLCIVNKFNLFFLTRTVKNLDEFLGSNDFIEVTSYNEYCVKLQYFTNDINIFGFLMYTHYYYLFLLSGWILTVAMICAIVLSLNHKKL